MNAQQEQREAIPAGRDGWGGPERERVAWQRAEERTHWARYQRRRGKELGELERRNKREWSALYGRQERQREHLVKDCRGVLGRLRAWRERGGGVREIGGAVRGRPEVLGRFRAELEGRHRWERASLGKAHSEAVREIERKEGEAYRSGMEGSQERAELAARTDGMSAHYDPPYRWVRAQALGDAGADGADAGDRRRALTRRWGLPWRRPTSGWRPRSFRRAIGRSGTMAPAASSL